MSVQASLAGQVDIAVGNVVGSNIFNVLFILGLAASPRQGATAVTFMTAPVAGTETIPGVGSVVQLDQAKSAELFTAMAEDRMEEYVEAHPDDVLKSDREIS